jgi:hypothetical protein
MDKDNRVSATCPTCREGELRRMDGPPEWYVLPAATLGLPDDEEKRVGRNDGLNWPHCDGLNWPHLRPTGGRPFELHRARAGGARRNGIQGGAVRADQTGP